METVQSRCFLYVLTLTLLFATAAGAATYMSVQDGLKAVIVQADDFEKKELTPSEIESINKIPGHRLKNEIFYLAKKQNSVIAYAAVLDIKGKDMPITFLVAADSTSLEVIGVEVLAFRESQGSEIRNRKFLKQFTGKNPSNMPVLSRNIDGISGATLSSRAAVFAVNKALAIFKVMKNPIIN